MTTAHLPITRVIVMEDRAQIERTGKIALTGGLQRFEVPGLAQVAVDRSLKVEVKGGTFVDAKLDRTWQEKPKGGLSADASTARRLVASLEQELLGKRDEASRLEARSELLSAARGDLLRAIAEQTGVGKTDPTWPNQLELLSTKQAELDEQVRVSQAGLTQLEARLAEARFAVRASEEKESDLRCTLWLSIDGQGEAEVRVSYLVPCAVWRPSYRASLTGETVLVEAEGVVWQRTGEDWHDVQLQFSTARPTLGTAPPSLHEDRVRTRPKMSEEKRVVDVTLREEVIQSAGETAGDPEMPGLDDGGEARLLDAPHRASVKSDGQPQRVPLFTFETKAQLERVCPAELTNLVFVVARFTNSSGQVLLAGPVDLVKTNGFVGRARMNFAAPGELVKLSFGNEDGVQVIRSTEEKVDEARLTGRRTTTRKVLLHVSNARHELTRLIIEERVPVSEVKEVEIQVLTKDCHPAPSVVTKEGIARLELELPPNGTHTVKFAWELSAAAKVAGLP